MLERKEETQDLSNIGHSHLKMHKDARHGWGMRSSAGCVTGRLSSSTLLSSPASSGKVWLAAEGCLSLHHAWQKVGSSPITSGAPDLSALRFREHSHKLPQALHIKSLPQTSQVHSAAVVAAATSKGRRQASAWPSNKSGSLCSCLCHFSRLQPRCSSYSCS